MNFTDTIALVRAGYKKKDIDAMKEEEAKEIALKQAKEPKEPEPKEPTPKEPEPKEPEPKEPTPKEPEVKDYEKLYKEALLKLDETNKELKSLQDDFKNKDMSGGIKSKEDMYKDTLDALY